MNSSFIDRKLKAFRKNLTHLNAYVGTFFSYLLKVLYHGGIPLSILYGKSTSYLPNYFPRYFNTTPIPNVHVVLRNR